MTRKHTPPPADQPTTYSHKFWENYTLFLVKQGINKNYIEWYVFRTKQYIALFPDQNIRTHTDKHVEQYFHKLGQNTRIKSWQFAQAIGAIQLLFSKALKAKWADDFDWEYWKVSAKQLEVDHVTVARDYTDPLADLDEPLSGEERCPPELYERYQPFLAEVIKVVRLKNYAMKTEKTYRGWIARFFYFHKREDVRTLGAAEAKQYLEYLALKRNVSIIPPA